MNIPPHRITSLHVRNVPVDVKAAFKAYCAARGYTMEGAVVTMMREAINTNRAIPVPRRKRVGEMRRR